MTEYKNNLHKYAMHFGTYMGIYWILKFILIPLGFRIPFLHSLFWGLTLAVPFLGYYFARAYRDKVCQGSITFTQAWLFTLFMYVFSSILTGLAHYIYFRYIDQGFLYSSFDRIINELKNMNLPQMETTISHFQTAFDYIASLRPIQLTMQSISQNIFYCNIISIFTALIVMRKPKNNVIPHQDNGIK